MYWELDGVRVFDDEAEVSPWDVAPGLWACVASDGGRSEVEATLVGGNVLLVLLDDIGVDRVGHYGLHADTPPTPRLDRLAAEGMRFERAYATPVCSATRAALLTGKQPTRTGVGALVELDDTVDWMDGHGSLAHLMGGAGYGTASVGKWHLSPGVGVEWADHPGRIAGFDWFRGPLNNPGVDNSAEVDGDYFRWIDDNNGVFEERSGYLTTATIDDAIDQVGTLPEPWFVYVPLNAAHIPLHVPPESLLDVAEPPFTSDADVFDAMVEATDRELGRLLDAVASVGDRTTVIVLSDNGTNGEVMRPPTDPLRSKGTVYEGGVRVPMWVSGPLVSQPGGVSDALVNVVDLYPSLAALAGGADDGQSRDGLSLLPYIADPARPSERGVVYTELFKPNGFGTRYRSQRMVTDGSYKIIESVQADDLHFHELSPDSIDEGERILERSAAEEVAYQALRDALEATKAELALP